MERSVRENSIRSEPFSLEHHSEWFVRTLIDPDVRWWMIEANGVPAGQVRYTRTAEGVEVAISVAEAARGHGYATLLLRETAAPARVLGGPFVALILPENASSIAAFTAAGYRPDGETERHGKRLLRFIA
jgi:RimJ/RimL family protein N-acetyltransferase